MGRHAPSAKRAFTRAAIASTRSESSRYLSMSVRLGAPSEVYRGFVAGGTMLVERGMLHEVGGFRRVRRHVDAQLIHAVRVAGGEIYRSHGLGYVLRRTDSGHTWQADLGDLRDRAVETWPGFRPGRLMEL